MGPAVRAKFRCMGIEKTWGRKSVVRLSPVAEDGHPENAAFWNATPSGSAKLTYQGDAPFDVGAYYYIDLGKLCEVSEESWHIETFERRRHGSGGVKLAFYRHSKSRPEDAPSDGLLYGGMEMGIDNKPALEVFSEPDGGEWSVVFSFAEASRD